MSSVLIVCVVVARKDDGGNNRWDDQGLGLSSPRVSSNQLRWLCPPKLGIMTDFRFFP